MRKMKNSKGFTLMEMLIVVAIIAILVAIMIPTMTSALEKARDAADAANLRSAYAEAMVKLIEGNTTTGTDDKESVTSAPITITGKVAGFNGISEIAGVSTTTDTVLKEAKAGQQITVTVTADGHVTFAKQ